MMVTKSFEESLSPSVVASSENVYSGFGVKMFKIKKKKNSKKPDSDHVVSVYHHNTCSKLRVKERLDFLRMVKHSQSCNKSGSPILLSNSR